MKIFGLEVKRNSEKRSVGGGGLADRIEKAWLLGDSGLGEYISPRSAQGIGAVYKCVRVISESFPTAPCLLYKELGNDTGRIRATKHPLYRVLKTRPNRWQSAFEFFEMICAHLALRGECFAYQQLYKGKLELIPMHPDKVRANVKGGDLLYWEYETTSGKVLKLLPESVLQVKFPGESLFRGESPINKARRAAGMAKKTEEYGYSVFARGVNPSGVLKHPKVLSDQAQTRLKEQFEKSYAGTSNAGGTLVLEEGLDWQKVGMSNADAQFVETWKMTQTDIAGVFRVAPHKIGELSGAKYANIEQQSLEHLTDTMLPYFMRFEQSLNEWLLTPQEIDEGYYFEFLIDNIARADMKTRNESMAIAKQNGWLNSDEIRAMENRAPIPNGKGKIFLQPANMVEAGSIGPVKSTEPGPTPTKREAAQETETPET